jgi:alkylated DNA repair dioxygenase AlkB
MNGFKGPAESAAEEELEEGFGGSVFRRVRGGADRLNRPPGTSVVPAPSADLFGAEGDGADGCAVTYFASLFAGDESRELLAELLRTTAWQQDRITLYRKSIALPRLTAWYGDPGLAYTYSGIRMEPRAWSPALRSVKARVEALCGQAFTSVLLNQYRHGQDGMAWHSDDEPELGTDPLIASVSFGATRRFRLRRKPHAKGSRPLAVDLLTGSCLVMSGRTQALWEHALAKTRKPVGPRVNLTFRQIGSGRSSPADQAGQKGANEQTRPGAGPLSGDRPEFKREPGS